MGTKKKGKRATESTLQKWRRTARAREIEGDLLRAMLEGSEEGTNGARVVSQGRVEAIRDGKAMVSAPGVFKAMQRALKGWGQGLKAGDWLWEWVRQAQQEEVISCDAQRRGRDGGREAGWRERLRLGEAGSWTKYLRAVRTAVMKVGDAGRLVRRDYRTVYQAVKRRAPGTPGESLKVALWDLAATEGLEVEGQGVDGVVSGNWKEAGWWRSVRRQLKHGGLGVEDLRRLWLLEVRVLGWAEVEESPGSGQRVLVHWFAGWGSGVHAAAEAAGLGVLAVELVASRAGQLDVGSTVAVQLDVASVAPRWLVTEAAWCAGRARADLWAHWAGPPCKSQAGNDAANRRVVQGRLVEANYRTSTGEPAHPEGSWRGDVARDGDRLAERILKALRAEDRWAVENPMGQGRGIMRERPWGREVEDLLHEVDYCAYWSKEERKGGRGCRKHTAIWTDVAWDPQGTTGSGRCRARCECGWRENGSWVHSKVEDLKRSSLKSRVPEALVAEWLEAAQEQGATSGRSWQTAQAL
jgi:hypothetical protein